MWGFCWAFKQGISLFAKWKLELKSFKNHWKGLDMVQQCFKQSRTVSSIGRMDWLTPPKRHLCCTSLPLKASTTSLAPLPCRFIRTHFCYDIFLGNPHTCRDLTLKINKGGHSFLLRSINKSWKHNEPLLPNCDRPRIHCENHTYILSLCHSFPASGATYKQ